ncbi:hypothetical protein SDC9_24856 [bioreactor metagenome]|uniref:Uncharacterized protein n=1 Tax=bioreactor metagenome TaxID=1076179 RepID=A0A644UJL0_9ZZZZ
MKQWSSLGSRVANARPRGLSGYKDEDPFLKIASRSKNRRPNKLEENLLGQVVDCCCQALWGIQELRVRKIIIASLCHCAGKVMQILFC